MQDFLITIDQGTTGSRVFIFDKQAKVLASAYQEFRQHFPQPGWVEHDPEEIWASIEKLLNEAIQKAGVSPKKAVGIGITNQRETTLLWEKENGRPIHNAIVWQCRRTSDFCEKLKKAGHETMVREKTGLVIDAYFSGTKIAWLLENVSGAKQQAQAGKLLFGTIDSYLLYKLTHGEVHRTDKTNASRTMLYNIREQRWDSDICSLLGIPENILPEAVNSASLFGKTKGLSSLPDGIPIYSMVGDQQSALFGQLCINPGDVKNTYGTGCFMVMNTGEQYIESQNGLITTIACDHKGEPAYALEGGVFIGGAVVQFLRDSFDFFKEAVETDAMVESIKDKKDEIVFVPAFAGLGAPHWDQYARGAIFGLSRDTSPAQITRAALKSIALQSKDLLDSMRKDASLQKNIDVKINSMRVDGGAVKNKYLMKYQASILGMPVLIPENTETTVMGAAYLAGLASKFWNSLDELKKLNPIKDEIQPDFLDKEEVSEELKLWDEAINKVKTK